MTTLTEVSDLTGVLAIGGPSTPPDSHAPFETRRLLRGTSDRQPRLDLGAHLRTHGAVPEMVRRGHLDLLDVAEAVDLRGRGGAAFPFVRKARGVRATRGRALVVGNGSEGEQASRKDTTLLQRVPHLVLDGLELAAVTVGAHEARLVVGDEAARRSVDDALAERPRGKGPRVRMTVVAVADTFIAGESSAVVRASSGQEPIPIFTLKRTGEGGVNGRPTLVSNVETLAQLALLARIGPGAYCAVGTADEPGTTLLTVHRGAGAEVLEVSLGTPLADVLGDRADARAVLIGGYHGTWLAPGLVTGTRLSRAGLQEVGGTLGAGVVVPLPPSACPLVEAAPVVRMLANASAGQCGPCVHGLRSIADRVQSLADGMANGEDLRLLDRWAKLVPGRGACAHPDGVVRFVSSLLSAYPTEVAVHQRHSCGRRLQHLLPIGVQA